mmetsp:Transcript_8901/g.54715  ORF Transcript_8901/g.54715 Transcript_8901/m.54715 type:complete len:234 (-) Transcript_8901:387-1088(-)
MHGDPTTSSHHDTVKEGHVGLLVMGDLIDERVNATKEVFSHARIPLSSSFGNLLHVSSRTKRFSTLTTHQHGFHVHIRLPIVQHVGDGAHHGEVHGVPRAGTIQDDPSHVAKDFAAHVWRSATPTMHVFGHPRPLGLRHIQKRAHDALSSRAHVAFEPSSTCTPWLGRCTIHREMADGSARLRVCDENGSIRISGSTPPGGQRRAHVCSSSMADVEAWLDRRSRGQEVADASK